MTHPRCVIVIVCALAGCSGEKAPTIVIDEDSRVRDLGADVGGSDVGGRVDATRTDLGPPDLGTDGADAVDTRREPDAALAALPLCNESFDELVGRFETAAPGRDAGFEPAVGAMAAAQLTTSIELGAVGAWAEAQPVAADAGYELCDGGDDEVRWVPVRLADGLPIILARRGDATDLVVEHPHPFFDGTLKTASQWWATARPRAMLINGTHRCASATVSACDGTTSVCAGSPAPYPVTDPAHSTTAPFHGAHLALADAWPTAAVVSLHGTAQDVAYISDGTRGNGASDNRVASVVQELAASFAAVGIRSCDVYDAAIPGPWLCGTTNVQGRSLNGSPDACSTPAATTSGRFLHLEQPTSLRDDAATAAAATLRALSLP